MQQQKAPRNIHWVGTAEIAEHFGVSPQAIRTWTLELGMPAYKVGRLMRYDFDACEAWVMQHRVGPTSKQQARPDA